MSSPADAFAHCEALVRAADKDRFLAALFAPAAARPALYALYAFNLEIARIRERIHEPLAGEIRLQWWSDALAGKAHGSFEANPVAAALCSTIERHSLPVEPLERLIAARRFDLYDDPMPTLAEFDDYTRATSSGLFELAVRILAPGDLPVMRAVLPRAGPAYAIAGLLQAFPIHAVRGQLFVPLEVLAHHGGSAEDVRGCKPTVGLRAALAELRALARSHLEAARPLVEQLTEVALPAMLPLALVRPLIARMERHGYDPFRVVELPQWRRQWRLWRAGRNPARIFA